MKLNNHNLTMTARLPKGYKPLCECNGLTISYFRGDIYAESGENGTLEKMMSLRNHSWKDSTRFFVRLFRMEPKLSVQLESGEILLALNRKIFLLNLQARTSRVIFTSREGFSDVLNICPASGDYAAFWGDYGSNSDRSAVQLYAMKPDGEVKTIYSFRPGQIRHVHNIVPALDGGYYILTGDTEPEAGIYYADAKFQTVSAVALGKQQYRAVVGFDTEQGLLYATDAVNEPNYLYLIKKDRQSERLSEINGSCIYGKKLGRGYLISTTVEPDERNRGPLALFSYKLGAGILSRDVHLIYISDQLEVSVVQKIKKDILPMKLFQYGSIQFAMTDQDSLWLYPVAVSKSDGRARKISMRR